MTQADIVRLPDLLPEIDRTFRRATGAGLAELARIASADPGLPVGDYPVAGNQVGGPVVVVPISAGIGFIPGFVDTVAAICRFIGCEASVAAKPDVAGLAAAAEEHAQLVLLADDERFICLNLRSGRLADNGEATGRGYAAALAAATNQMGRSARGAGEKRDDGETQIFVLGLGPVGRAAARWLRQAGFRVLAYEPDEDRARMASRELDLGLAASPAAGFAGADLILDACPACDVIHAEQVTSRTVVAAPGMPSGITDGAADLLGDRYLHEPLALGVATMVFMAATTLGECA